VALAPSLVYNAAYRTESPQSPAYFHCSSRLWILHWDRVGRKCISSKRRRNNSRPPRKRWLSPFVQTKYLNFLRTKGRCLGLQSGKGLRDKKQLLMILKSVRGCTLRRGNLFACREILLGFEKAPRLRAL